MIPIQQFERFLAAGVLNTALDMGLYWLLIRRPLNLPKIRAHLFSSSAATVCSFLLNRGWVFGYVGNASIAFGKFFCVNLAQILLLQPLIIHLFCRFGASLEAVISKLWSAVFFKPLDFGLALKLLAKAAAICSAIVWNFGCYKYVVFL